MIYRGRGRPPTETTTSSSCGLLDSGPIIVGRENVLQYKPVRGRVYGRGYERLGSGWGMGHVRCEYRRDGWDGFGHRWWEKFDVTSPGSIIIVTGRILSRKPGIARNY